MATLLKSEKTKQQHLINLGDKENPLGDQLHSLAPLKVVIVYAGLDIMNVFTPENIKLFLIRLVSYSVLHLAPEHHLTALHVVVHHILKIRHQSFCIHYVEIDQVICSDLYPDVPFYEVDEPSHFYFVVLHPLGHLRHLVEHLPEK